MKIFLDIDGVMVHGNPHQQVEIDDDGFYKFISKAVDFINSIDSEEIILSTSHRHRYDLNEWEIIFMKRGVKFNKISKIEYGYFHNVSRRTEIENWIESKHYQYNEIIIIDDDKSLNGLSKELKDRVILTSSYYGLHEDNNKDLERILNSTNKELTGL
ncbi:hypothetical protein HX001_01100 [Empedobacter brevis]|uniref:Uncharacterized protein n=1 Tax=Empedobacter brevis TaxID=247 RepID=A0AAJ1QBR9_9FLAO|nr:HAD domain-containing protein [Empedobacter brevis]MDM1071085.1 hypothetical protein [Empedobacter brevis]